MGDSILLFLYPLVFQNFYSDNFKIRNITFKLEKMKKKTIL